MNITPSEIIYNIFSYLDIISKSNFGKTNKFNYKVYKKYIVKNTKINQSLNYYNEERIKSYHYHYIDNLVYSNLYPSLLYDNFIEIILQDTLQYFYKIIIFEPIYNSKKCIFDYIREMNNYKIYKVS